MADQQTLTQLYREVISYVNSMIRRELRDQGHYNTGKLSQSIKGYIVKIPRGEALTGTSLYYSGILDNGVTASRVPYNAGSGAGKSKLITALTLYFRQKGLTAAQAKGAAFATAKKMKEEGSPTKGSYAYSRNGYRVHFMEKVFQAIRPEVNRKMTDGINAIILQEFKKTKSETI